jgi:hypothetical protein
MPAPILAHIHLRKCGGTSFAQLLERHFGPRHVSLYADDIYFAYSAEELERALSQTPDVAAFSSHHVRVFPPVLLGRPVLYVTFLRDPVRQFVSHMTHVRKHYAELTDPSLVRSLPPDAPELSLREFARWLLTHEKDIYFRENYDIDFFTRYNPGPRSRVSRAKSILTEFFFVGITERMDESMRSLRRLAEARGLDFPSEPLRVVNASSEPGDDLDWIHPQDEVGAMLLDSVCEDRELYRWVLARQSGAPDASAHPVGPLIETILREGVAGEFRVAGEDAPEAAVILRSLQHACGAPDRRSGGRIALLWLAGDADALRSLYPQVVQGGYVVVDQYGADARVRTVVDDYRAEMDIREPVAAIGSGGAYWRVDQPMLTLQDATPALSNEVALTVLLDVYGGRPDLRESCPEAANADYKRLIHWACQAIRGDFPDSSAELLQPYREWYERNDVDGIWPLLEKAVSLAANPLPETLRVQRVHPHVMMLALLIVELGLREIVEVRAGPGTCDGVLVEAAHCAGGRVRCFAMGAAEVTRPIDLLFINCLPLYSQAAAELQACGPYLHEGSWIALHHTVSSPGVTKALTEAMRSFGWRPRVYPFLHDRGLILVRVAQ